MIYGKALDYLLDLEGGESDHPEDRGGHTRFGVTQKSYDAYRGSKGLPLRSVSEMTPPELSEFYRDGYWRPAGEGLPGPLNFVVFQFGVLAGPGRSVKMLQKVIGLEQDGVCGPKTKTACWDGNVRCLCDEHIALEREYVDNIVKNDPSQKVFIKGWHNRFDKVHAICLKELS